MQRSTQRRHPFLVYRLLCLVLSIAIGTFGSLLFTSELIRPLPSASSEYTADRYRLAADVAGLRGELWADAAIAEAAAYVSAASRRPHNESSLLSQAARTNAYKALQLSPLDVCMWLLLSGLPPDGSESGRAVQYLKMSYYASSGSAIVIQARLKAVGQLASISDDELRDLIRGEIRTITVQKTALRSLIISAYETSSPAGRALFRQILTDTDTELLRSLRAP